MPLVVTEATTPRSRIVARIWLRQKIIQACTVSVNGADAGDNPIKAIATPGM